jgi:hypothetical protein
MVLCCCLTCPIWPAVVVRSELCRWRIVMYEHNYDLKNLPTSRARDASASRAPLRSSTKLKTWCCCLTCPIVWPAVVVRSEVCGWRITKSTMWSCDLSRVGSNDLNKIIFCMLKSHVTWSQACAHALSCLPVPHLMYKWWPTSIIIITIEY